MEVFTAILRGKCNCRPIILQERKAILENHASGGLVCTATYTNLWHLSCHSWPKYLNCVGHFLEELRCEFI